MLTRNILRFILLTTILIKSAHVYAENYEREINMDTLFSMIQKPPEDKIIIHVPQTHDATNLGARDTNDALASQFQLGQLFLKIEKSGHHPKVWVEGYTASDPQVNVAEIRKTFPKGWPTSLSAFTKKQRLILLKWGGPSILGALGSIPPIRGAENGLLNSVVLNKVLRLAQENNISACESVEQIIRDSKSDLKRLILDDREKAALNIIDSESEDKSISFLVYGKAHDFLKYGSHIYRFIN